MSILRSPVTEFGPARVRTKEHVIQMRDDYNDLSVILMKNNCPCSNATEVPLFLLTYIDELVSMFPNHTPAPLTSITNSLDDNAAFGDVSWNKNFKETLPPSLFILRSPPKYLTTAVSENDPEHHATLLVERGGKTIQVINSDGEYFMIARNPGTVSVTQLVSVPEVISLIDLPTLDLITRTYDEKLVEEILTSPEGIIEILEAAANKFLDLKLFGVKYISETNAMINLKRTNDELIIHEVIKHSDTDVCIIPTNKFL